MKNKKLKCNFCDNNGASHIECRYGKIELVYDVDEICFYFKEEKNSNSYIVCDNCFNEIFKQVVYEYININYGNISKIHLDSKGYISKNACQKLEIEFKKEDSKICQV